MPYSGKLKRTRHCQGYLPSPNQVSHNRCFNSHLPVLYIVSVSKGFFSFYTLVNGNWSLNIINFARTCESRFSIFVSH